MRSSRRAFSIISIFLILFIPKRLPAQDTSSIVIHKDPRVEVLVKKQSEVNAAIRKANTRSGKGYRILVLTTNKRDEAIAAKTKIYSYFPELKSYLLYQSPNFRLKAGNFKTKEDAEQYLKSLSSYFPKGVFIVNDTIELNPD